MVTTGVVDKLGDFCNNPPDGWNIVYLQETESTNQIAMEQGRAGKLAGTIVIADTQTAGRGRLGKAWHSYAGCGLYISIIMRPKLDLAHLSRITLAAGVALAETAASFTTRSPMLKWPNDLYIDGQKCGGILAESNMQNSHAPLVILGLGVNIHAPEAGYSSDLRVKAGSLNDFTNNLVMRSDFLQKIIPAIKAVVRELETGQFQKILSRWRQYDFTKGKKITWLTTGGEVIEGVSSGINDEGLLFITDVDGNTHEVVSGDVQLFKVGM